MTIKQAEKLKTGDKVRWPEGANGCKESIGIVHVVDGTRFVEWDDGQRSFLHDVGAIKFIEVI